MKISPGDMVVADADAVLILPAGIASAALEKAEARAKQEAEKMRRLRAGETTLQILGLDRESGI